MRKILLAALAGLLLMVAVPFVVMADWTDMPYWISVDRVEERVTIYRVENNEVVYRWICSTGKNTPVGRFIMPVNKSSVERKEAFVSSGDSYFIWRSQIKGAILFHSWIYTSRHLNAIQMESVNDLGKAVSHGCVRLPVDGARWIALNCLPGTLTVIHNGPDDPLITEMLGSYEPSTDIIDLEDQPKKVTLEPSAATIEKGEQLQLTPVLEPEGTQTVFHWSSSDRGVAYVDQTGKVTGRSSGIATITALSDNGLIVKVVIDVNEPDVPRRVQLDADSEFTLIKGDTLQLHATVIPETAKTGLRWGSSSTAV